MWASGAAQVLLKAVVSGPSTAGDWRVGMEAFSAGRVSVNWMKLVPFLENCGLDVAGARTSKCKMTSRTFEKVSLGR